MNSKKELDVDVIGGQGSLTTKEEKAISAFIQKSKQKASKHKALKNKRTKITA